MAALRVCAYNVHGFRAGVRSVAEAIAGERPDVVFVNEAGSRRRLRRFARALGGESASGIRWRGGIPNAVVARRPWRILDSSSLSFTRSGRLIPRGALIAQAGRSGERVWAVSVHLGLSDREREGHVRELTDRIGTLHGPVIIGGDLNEDAERPAAAWLAGRYWDAFAGAGEGEGLTFPSHEPRARIDYVFLGEGLTAARSWVLDTPLTRAASDHLPLFADVETGSG